MRILALHLGKYKTVACEHEAETGGHRFATVLTTPKALHDLMAFVMEALVESWPRALAALVRVATNFLSAKPENVALDLLETRSAAWRRRLLDLALITRGPV